MERFHRHEENFFNERVNETKCKGVSMESNPVYCESHVFSYTKIFHLFFS